MPSLFIGSKTWNQEIAWENCHISSNNTEMYSTLYLQEKQKQRTAFNYPTT